MLRAGWAGGMFRASKLCQSSSASGPSAIWYPIPMNTSSSSSRVLLVAPQLLQSIGRVARNLRRGLMLQLVLQFFESHAPTSSSKDLEGSVNRNVEPSPGADVADSLPPCASTRPRLIQRPRPEPVGRVSARRKNLVKMRGKSELGIPSPLSLTDTATMSGSSGDVQRSPLMRIPFGSAYLAAFSTRLVSTCSTLSGSA